MVIAQTNDFATAVVAWFQQHGRHDLPWQQNPTPYRVWVSEIMLQQTQVATVIPYYQRFMAAFPTVADLARAESDQVMQLWAGLGYYARARNLHHAAQQVVNEYGGEFPNTLEGLMALRGIGRSTAGAVLSLGWRQYGVILDGNVKRVLARCFAVAGDPASTAAQQQLWQLTEQLTPIQDNAAYTQAMMDLGATLCTRSKPLCLYCPLQSRCQAYALGTPTAFPHKKASKKIPEKQAFFLIVQNQQGECLWWRRPPVGIWGGLWCLPEIAGQETEQLLAGLAHWSIRAQGELQYLPPLEHTFSHYRLLLQPVLVRAEIASLQEGESRWLTPQSALGLGLPAPIQKLLTDYLLT